MLGRGIDQILAHPSHPELYEPYISSALSYVELAEQAHGAIPRHVDPAYVWGDTLAALIASSPTFASSIWRHRSRAQERRRPKESITG